MSSILIARSIQKPPQGVLRGFLYGADIKPSTRQLVAVVRQFASANFCRRLPLCGIRQILIDFIPPQGVLRVFLYGAGIEPSTRQLVAVVRIRVSESCRGFPLSGIRQILIDFITPSAMLRGFCMERALSRVRGNLLPSFAFASANLAVGSRSAGFGKFSLIL